jgi:L-histidine Nalpha-methyltransferase
MTRPGLPATAGRAHIDVRAQFAADVRYYLSLTPRQLPSEYLYDPLGSALFDAICRLPWYGITRAESRLLTAHGADIFERIGGLSTIVELGPGNGEKLRLLLKGHTPTNCVNVHLVDVSMSALDLATRTIGDVGPASIVTHCAPYDDGLREAVAQTHGRSLIAFLGSNIGNFDPPGATAFLYNVRTNVRRGDALLLGVDLVKPEPAVLLAYDDPLGVTAAFNRNLLVRINRELGADFDLDQFQHKAVWNGSESRVEMHLVARCEQDVRIERSEFDLHFGTGERIWTESSYKYSPERITALLRSCGFAITCQWIDEDDKFALTLAEAS